MLCTYCADERLLATLSPDGKLQAQSVDYALLKNELLDACAEAGNVNRYTPAATVSVLDRLLAMGHLDVRSYLELLPSGVVADRERLLDKISLKGEYTDE